MDDFWADGESRLTGAPLTPEAVRAAEEVLGYKLPESYLRVLRIRNGGLIRRRCFPTQVPTSFAIDHVEVTAVFGIGCRWGIDGSFNSQHKIREYNYPNVGVVIAETPEGGYDTVMLDYSVCGPGGEPRVIHADTEDGQQVITVLAPDFEAFARGLVDCERSWAEIAEPGATPRHGS